MLMLRAMHNGKKVAERAGPDAESDLLQLAMQLRVDGPVTIQRQQRSPDPNPDGRWFWKRHMLIEQFQPAGRSC